MEKFLIGKKIGMTQIFRDNGECIPATVIHSKCCVINMRTMEKDKYNAVVLGYGEVPESKLNKPLQGYFRKLGVKPHRILKEFRVSSVENFTIGQEINVDVFKEGDLVDVSGRTKGRGFCGVVKRWNFAGGPKSHGQSDKFRSPGSIGSQRPQRVLKGKKMAGHYGNEWVTIRNLEVVKVIPENSLLLVKGGIPGNKNSIVLIKSAHRAK
jgi:large subunit ribosomal protein L3